MSGVLLLSGEQQNATHALRSSLRLVRKMVKYPDVREILKSTLNEGRMNVPSESEMAIAAKLWDYLRLDQEVRPAECILVFGGHDLGVARRAGELYRASVSQIIRLSGGSS